MDSYVADIMQFGQRYNCREQTLLNQILEELGLAGGDISGVHKVNAIVVERKDESSGYYNWHKPWYQKLWEKVKPPVEPPPVSIVVNIDNPAIRSTVIASRNWARVAERSRDPREGDQVGELSLSIAELVSGNRNRTIEIPQNKREEFCTKLEKLLAEVKANPALREGVKEAIALMARYNSLKNGSSSFIKAEVAILPSNNTGRVQLQLQDAMGVMRYVHGENGISCDAMTVIIPATEFEAANKALEKFTQLAEKGKETAEHMGRIILKISPRAKIIHCHPLNDTGDRVITVTDPSKDLLARLLEFILTDNGIAGNKRNLNGSYTLSFNCDGDLSKVNKALETVGEFLESNTDLRVAALKGVVELGPKIQTKFSKDGEHDVKVYPKCEVSEDGSVQVICGIKTNNPELVAKFEGKENIESKKDEKDGLTTLKASNPNGLSEMLQVMEQCASRNRA